ncbi:MAG: aspartate kinase [Micromonosporaceae bacterium]
MRTVVQKFGGSSLATLDQIRSVADHVARGHRAGHRMVVVVSARGETTDELLALAAAVGGAAASGAAASGLAASQERREVDQLLATGECASAALLALALRGIGVPAVSLTGAQAGVVATPEHGAGVIEQVCPRRLRRVLARGSVAVVAGFQGIDRAGDIVTLGRGGSDTTAVAMAAALGTGRCEIYTDVAGIFTADPRLVDRVRVHTGLSSAVTFALASAGARVLHARCVALAARHGIDIHVADASSRAGGTLVRGRPPAGLEQRCVLVGVAHDSDAVRVVVTRPGGRPAELAAEVLALLAAHGSAVDMVSAADMVSAGSAFAFTARASALDDLRGPLRELAGPTSRIVVDEHLAKVSLVGVGLLDQPRPAARMLTALRRAGLDPSGLSLSHHRACVTVRRSRVADAVRALHDRFENDFTSESGADALRLPDHERSVAS